MTRVQMLASSPRPLADVLVDGLRTSGNSLLRLRAPSSDDIGDQHQYPLRLEDKEEGSDSPSTRVMRPDEVAVAILFGQALDRRRDVLAKLQDRDTVAIIEVPGEEYVDFVERLFKRYVIGTEAPVLDGDGLSLQDTAVAAPRTIAIFARRGDEKSRKAAKGGNAEFAAAMQRRCAIIGIAAEPERLLPPHLVRMAEHRIVLGRLDGAAIAAVIEAITSRHPGVVDEQLARSTTLEALNIAVRADLGAGRSLARLGHLVGRNDSEAEPRPLLSDMHGLGAAKSWGMALIQDLRDYAAGRLAWAEVDKGCLLTGAPGTGKTSFARALAREANVHFIATSYAQWQAHREGHLGHVTQAIRKAFAEAQLQSPSILFIDEIDTLPARGSGKWNDDWWTSITNCLLESLDGFERREGVVVIAACNADPSRLDPALVRSGRLDRHIEISLPDVPALVGILRTHLAADLAGADLRDVALVARGGTGADVERFVREARGRARRAGRPLDLPDVLDAVRNGKPAWPADVRRRVAYHESGHAIALLALGIAEPKALSIGGTGGLAESDLGEMRAMTRSHLEKYLVTLLAGRAAEQLTFGEATAGAGGSDESDLGRATMLATRLETDYGLGAFGLVCIPGGSSGRDLLLLDTLRSAVGGTIDRAYAAALELLDRNQHALEALATALFGAGYLDRADIQAILVHSPLGAQTMAVVPTAPSSEPLDAPSDDTAIAGD
ncbi:MAG TPA: AAA family ATPase, partial [Xanthobacteraceae bacterium]|nr:AAA family ATPase [Xanthobacteraceae bacterium]